LVFSADEPVAALFLPLTKLYACFEGGAFGLKPRFPDRARLSDPAPLPNDGPLIEQGPSHGDDVEAVPVVDRLAPLQVDYSLVITQQFL
jgi:hypothetical protein